MDFGYLLGGQGVQLPDPVRQAQAMMSLAQVANQNKLAQYTLAAAQRKDAAATGVGQALGGLDINDDAAVTRAVQSADPEARQGLLDAVLTARKSAAETGFKKSESAAKDFEVQKGQAAMMGNLANFLANKPDVSMADVRASQSVLANLKMDPNAILPPPGVDPKAHWQALAGQAMDAAKQMELQGQAATRAETATHNRATEGNQAATLAETTARDRATADYQRGELGNSNLRARAAAVAADPFGLSGLNPGQGGGAPAAPTGMPSSNVIPQATQSARDGQAYDLLQQERSQAANIQEASALDREIQTRFPNGRPAMQGPQAAGGAPSPAAAIQAGLHGDEFLQSLPPQISGMVKALAEGREPFPSGAALRSPQTQQLLSLVSQYDPNFDATKYGARNALRTDFAKGKNFQVVQSMDQVMQHLAGLKDAFDEQGNFGGPAALLNSPKNAIEMRVGSDAQQGAQKAVQFHANAVADELAKIFRSSGMSEAEAHRWLSTIDPNMSPAAQASAIQSALDLINGRMNAIGNNWNVTMGDQREPLSFLSKTSQTAYNALGAGKSAPKMGPGQAPTDPLGGGTQSKEKLLMDARDAISKGADPAKVKARLQSMGVTDSP